MQITAAGVYITSLGNITLDADDIPDVDGGSLSLNATGILSIAVTGGTNTRAIIFLTGATINLTGGNSGLPVTLQLSLQEVSTFIAGAGGFNAPFVDILTAGAELNITSGGDIIAHSITFTDFYARGSVNAAGAISITTELGTGTVTAGTSIDVGGSIFAAVIDAGTTITAGGDIQASYVTAGGNISANITRIQTIIAPTGILSVADQIRPSVFSTDPMFPEQGAKAPHDYTVDSIIAPNGIDFSGNQFGGINGYSSGGILTINATTILFNLAGGIGGANFNGADAGTLGFDSEVFTTVGGDGGTFIVNATGNITTVLGADITATTGLNESGDLGFNGNGGNVTLNSTAGTVTVDSLIQVSSNDPDPDGPEPIRRSASGGNITLHSGLTTGLGISIGGNAQLLSLLGDSAPGPGGTITLTTDGADIHMGEIPGALLQADHGTIDIHQTAEGSEDTSLIEIYNTILSAETISIASSGDLELGLEGSVSIDGITISLTAANDLTMEDFFNAATAVDSSGDVTISAGNAIDVFGDLSIERFNGGRSTGLNITIDAGTDLTVGGGLYLVADLFGLDAGGNISVTAGGDISIGDDLTAYAVEMFPALVAGVGGGSPGLNAAEEVDLGVVTVHADGTITVGGTLNVLGEVSAGGAITAGTLASNNVSSDTSINALDGGITRFSFSGSNPLDILHTLSAPVVTSTDGINFDGVAANGDFSMATDGGHLVINADSLSFGFIGVGGVSPLGLFPGDIVGPVTFNGGDGSGVFNFDPADGGTFTVNTTGAITVYSDIEATTGHFPAAPSATPAGFGGTVNLNSTTGTVTVNSRIEVSSAEPSSTMAPFRQSASGGNISITSGKTDGVAIDIGTGARLLSLLDQFATGPGGTITISATGDDSSIEIDNANGDPGEITADYGTIDINHQGNNGIINIANANMHADIVKIEVLGADGTLNIGGGMISADSMLRLYAAGSNGSINFTADVTLSGGSIAAVIAANTVTILNGVTVTISGSIPAMVYATIANYDMASGGNGFGGTFGGAGATTQSFPPGGPVVAGSPASVGNTGTSAALVSNLSQSSRPSFVSRGVALAAASPVAEGFDTPQPTGRKRIAAASGMSRTHRFAGANQTSTARTNAAFNTNNSAQLLSLLETAPESGTKIRFTPKQRLRNQKIASDRTSDGDRRPAGNSPEPSEARTGQNPARPDVGLAVEANNQVANGTGPVPMGRSANVANY